MDHGHYRDSSVKDISGLDTSLRSAELLKNPKVDSFSISLASCLSSHNFPISIQSHSSELFFSGADSGAFLVYWSSRETPVSLHSGSTMDPYCYQIPESTTTVGVVEQLDSGQEEEDMELEVGTFPMLVRSMSTSRRHSWEFPLSPVEPGRRLSLDTSAMDSDGDREEDLQQSTHIHQYFVYPECLSDLDEPDRLTEKPLTSSETKHTELESGKSGKILYSESEVMATEHSRGLNLSYVLETSTQADTVEGEERDLDDKLHSRDVQSHMTKPTGSSMEDKEMSGSVTWYEFLSNENDDEEEDRTEKAELGNKKVKRTFSSLRNRVTGSFNKDKGKSKEKDRGREKEKESKEKFKAHSNGHQLVPGMFSSCTTCSLCSKTLQKKNSLQCQNCAVNVHRNCRRLLAECSSRNKLKDSPKQTTGAVQRKVQYYNQALKESSANGPSNSLRGPGMTVSLRGQNNQTSISSTNTSLGQNSSSGSIPGEMDDVDNKFKILSDDAISLPPLNAESIILEDAQYAKVQADLESDAQEFEAESWSLAVEPQYLNKHTKVAVKRQDVIYELIQTEMHHVRTLKVMKWVYAHKMRETLQMDDGKLERLFPRLECLLEVHQFFLLQLKERRRQSLEPGSEHNFSIQRIGDILTLQFSGEIGERMEEMYGDFCSHHTEAVSYYKDQMQNNKKFQNLIRKINNLSVVRRLGVPECILLVTQRITKYPVLVERILQNTEAGTEEHMELGVALDLIKDVIKKVDGRVNDYEKAARLREIANKMEPKTQGKIKDGRVLSKEDIAQGSHKLLYEGTVNWKAASGRLKDILAVLLTDVLLLLQEKDQKYTFSAVDSKPSVISLQKLIVREVAHEEKAMFLICASSSKPEMYEIHTTSKEERNTWMAVIRQAVESYSHTEEGQKEERASRLEEFQEQLRLKDAEIIQSLTEKLQIFAEMSTGMEDMGSRTQLLLRGDSSDLQQGETLLKGAISEVERLQDLLLCGKNEAAPHSEGSQGSGGLPRRADTFGGYDSSPTMINKIGSMKKTHNRDNKQRERSQRARSDPQLKEITSGEVLEHLADETLSLSLNSAYQKHIFEAEFLDRVLMLSQRLYSLQAIISQQDSHIDMQRASLAERERAGRLRGSLLLEQEKQRSLEKQREELATFQRLQNQHRQELVRWERERERQEQEAKANNALLLQREEECQKLEAQLAEERKELESQREKYQQDLERLREATRAVEKEKEWLEQQKRLKKQKTSPGLLRPEITQDLPLISSFNGDIGLINTGDDLGLAAKPHIRYSLSLAPGDHPERPEVLPRRESSSSLAIKTEVPIHLVSTTNQLHKQGGVQQQIPTKLAALSKGKEKGGKSKSSHRTDSSASLDMKQMLPLKLSGKEDGNSKTKRSVSPHQAHHPDPVIPGDSHIEVQSAYRSSKRKQAGQNMLNDLSPPFQTQEDVPKEDVIFF
ncbi:rho guanine nucleotide exchange factor 18 isoform X2 [Scleropages formosus]|uniref:Rho/Rac guanine nucleotide exchange factor 18 n=1 Tax=Scleropages formosus TaxID=113540 RepID=A0A8C9R780_SCLFO|nr:rho guanine nucleotide exchange factor 18 isoform X2 [Scleropages formosus]